MFTLTIKYYFIIVNWSYKKTTHIIFILCPYLYSNNKATFKSIRKTENNRKILLLIIFCYYNQSYLRYAILKENSFILKNLFLMNIYVCVKHNRFFIKQFISRLINNSLWIRKINPQILSFLYTILSKNIFSQYRIKISLFYNLKFYSILYY